MLVIILEETGSLLYISPGHEDLDRAEKKWPATMEAIDGDSWRKWPRTGMTEEHLFLAYSQGWAVGNDNSPIQCKTKSSFFLVCYMLSVLYNVPAISLPMFSECNQII